MGQPARRIATPNLKNARQQARRRTMPDCSGLVKTIHNVNMQNGRVDGFLYTRTCLGRKPTWAGPERVHGGACGMRSLLGEEGQGFALQGG